MNISRVAFSWFFFWIIIASVGAYFLFPLRNSLRFGIDLVGGTYITLEVQTDKAVESNLIADMQAITKRLVAANQPEPTMSVVENNSIILTFENANDVQRVLEVIRKQRSDLIAKSENNVITLKLSENAVDSIKQEAVLRNIEVLRTRLDRLSVAEITIAKQGTKEIVVELPDVADPEQAKSMIGKAAVLEFRLVEKMGRSYDDILYELDGELPPDMEILPGTSADEFYLVNKYADLTGSDLRDAKPQLDPNTNVMGVAFRLTYEGGEKFYELTSKNIHRNLAIVLDNVIISAPEINAGISDSGVISGRNFTNESARELALMLKSGAFVAPVTFEEQRQIGPSLGAESIRQGLISCLVGLGLIFIFCIVFYKVSGFFAFIALVYNMLLILIGLAWVQATLTLPGIAGMILTVGMAIDASILIFERIKEEMATGMAFKNAVQAGFAGAMRVIIDANVTTLIVGVVLYYFGTGPIQGFAVTMILGIVATLITGLFFLKSLFMFVLDNFEIKKISI